MESIPNQFSKKRNDLDSIPERDYMGTSTSKPTRVDCSKVSIQESTFSTPTNKMDGAFANVDIMKGELVEKGIVRRIGDRDNRAIDGMKCPYVFTWSDEVPNHTWALGSGCSTFYNSALDKDANTTLTRFYDEDRFEIYATRDIKMGEELTHTYKSLEWRDVFESLRKSNPQC